MTDQPSTQERYEPYNIIQDRAPGRIEFSRDTEEAPGRIGVSLALLRDAHPATLYANFNTIQILDDVYEVVGWDAQHGCLVCELVIPDAR